MDGYSQPFRPSAALARIPADGRATLLPSLTRYVLCITLLTVSLFHHGDETPLLTFRAVLAYSSAFPFPRPDWNPPRAYILRHVG